jgi:hypothetical protein
MKSAYLLYTKWGNFIVSGEFRKGDVMQKSNRIMQIAATPSAVAVVVAVKCVNSNSWKLLHCPRCLEQVRVNTKENYAQQYFF